MFVSFTDSWLCLTDHQPPILGSKKDICNGAKPESGPEIFEKLTKLAELADKNKTEEWNVKEDKWEKEMENLEKEHQSDVNSWAVGLVLGIFITMIVTAIVTGATVKFCCS